MVVTGLPYNWILDPKWVTQPNARRTFLHCDECGISMRRFSNPNVKPEENMLCPMCRKGHLVDDTAEVT